MSKHIIERTAPVNYRVPENIPPAIKYHTIVADPPWTKNQSGRGSYGGAINHYDLMSLERIKQMPVSDLAAKNAHCYLWVMDGNIDEGLEVMKAWGFRYLGVLVWAKFRTGLGCYYRHATELCLFGVRGKLPPKTHSQMNIIVEYPTQCHSEKPRSFASVVERVSPGPYLELFCRRRPASREDWHCWGNETEGGADIFIPGYPVPKYSFEKLTEDSPAQTPEVKPDTKEEV